MVGNTGVHLVIDFRDERRVYAPYRGVLSRSLPYLPLIYPKRELFYEKMVITGDYICSLVREEKKTNWLEYKVKKIVKTVFDGNGNEEWIK